MTWPCAEFLAKAHVVIIAQYKKWQSLQKFVANNIFSNIYMKTSTKLIKLSFWVQIPILQSKCKHYFIQYYFYFQHYFQYYFQGPPLIYVYILQFTHRILNKEVIRICLTFCFRGTKVGLSAIGKIWGSRSLCLKNIFFPSRHSEILSRSIRRTS